MSEKAEARKEWTVSWKELLAGLLILAGLFVGWHVVPALAARDIQPIACQVNGGNWNLWSGWSCN